MLDAPRPQELTVITKTYDLLVWTADHVGRFPRSHRFSAGERLEKQVYGILENLLRAKFSRAPVEFLKAANLELEIVRFQFRFARDLKCLSVDSYGYAARAVNEIGQMVGGWIRSKDAVGGNN